MLMRSATASDLGLLLSCRPTEPVRWVSAERHGRESAVGSHRPEWTWVAEEDGELVARAIWWAPPGREHPLTLDCLWVADRVVDRIAVAADLIATAHLAHRHAGARHATDFEIDVRPDWRADAAALAAVEWRQQAAARAGLTHTLERVSFLWTPGVGVPVDPHRLVFVPERDDEVFVDAFRRVAEGSLDDLTRRNVAQMGADDQARDDLEFYLGLPGERDWWRLAHTREGDLVGFAIPSRSAYDASVSFLGVVPDRRGHGYVDDLLAEITRQHAGRGAQRITGTTDTTNAPMAAAFLRGGYECTGVRMVLSVGD